MTLAKRTLLQYSPQVGAAGAVPEAMLPVSSPDPSPGPVVGSVIDNRYRVERVVGKGAVGVVYAVRHTTLGKRFALKALLRELAADPEVSQRFMQEARAAGSGEHPGRVETTDFGHLPSGEPYFVMEWLEAEALARRADPPSRERPSLRLVRNDDQRPNAPAVLDEPAPAAAGPARPPWSKLLLAAAAVLVAGGAFGALLALHEKGQHAEVLSHPVAASAAAAAPAANTAARSPSVTAVSVQEMRANAAEPAPSAATPAPGAPLVHATAAGRAHAAAHTQRVSGKHAPKRLGGSEIVDPWGR